MLEIKAPQDVPFTNTGPMIFLAGSIDQGAAEHWQKRVVDALKDTSYIFLNPRRDDWDNTWEEKKENSQFFQQVNWELHSMEIASGILFYFAPGSKAPVTMAEFGLWCGKNPSKMLVVCPDGFWKKGNVDIMCQQYGVDTCPSLEEAILTMREADSKYREDAKTAVESFVVGS